MINKKVKTAFLFGGVAAGISSIYVANLVMDPGSLEYYLWQFKGDPAIEEHDLSITDRIIRIFNEHKRYFHNFAEGSFSVLFLIAVTIKGKYLWNQHRNLLLYPLICAFLLACISQGLTSKYSLLFLPQAILIMALAFNHYISIQFTKEKLIMVAFLFLAYGGFHLHHSLTHLNGEMPRADRNALIGSNIPHGSRVYSNVSFFFNEVENYTINSLIAYDLLVFRYHKLDWSQEALFQHIASLGCHYIAFDLLYPEPTIDKLFNSGDFHRGKIHYGFEVIQSENDYVVMKKAE